MQFDSCVEVANNNIFNKLIMGEKIMNSRNQTNSGLLSNIEYNSKVKSNGDFLNHLYENLPEFFTNSKSFDTEKFLSKLKENNISEISNGYQLDFIGKSYAKKQSGEKPTTVVVPNKIHNEKSENKSSQNLFFTGDNLETLRHLRQNYSNSVDFIYIDPPYNTGSDGFVYSDKFEYSDDKLKEMFGLNDDELRRLKSIQGRSSHSAWLTFMYPRIVLARKLLKDTGGMFVSIDDNEQANLKLLMDDIFGEGNFIQEIAWRRTDNQPNIGQVARVKEYILVYAKSSVKFKMGRLSLSDNALKEYRYEDEHDGKFRRGILLDKTRGRYEYNVTTKSGKVLNGPWMVTEEKFKEMDANNQIYWTEKGDEQPYSKIYLKNSKGAISNDFWNYDYGTNQRASREVEELFGKRVFDFPKPVSLINNLLKLGTDKNSLVLDFFAGSATTAEAVMHRNMEDDGNRKFIMVQIDAPLDGKSVPAKEGYETIDEISRARIEKAAAKMQSQEFSDSKKQDLGFKHYTIEKVSANTIDQMYEFDPNVLLTDNLIDDIQGGAETILTTWLVSDGYKFDEKVKKVKFGDSNAYHVDDCLLYILDNSWDTRATKELLNKIGTHKININSIIVSEYALTFSERIELKNNVKTLKDKNFDIIVEVRD